MTSCRWKSEPCFCETLVNLHQEKAYATANFHRCNETWAWSCAGRHGSRLRSRFMRSVSIACAEIYVSDTVSAGVARETRMSWQLAAGDEALHKASIASGPESRERRMIAFSAACAEARQANQARSRFSANPHAQSAVTNARARRGRLAARWLHRLENCPAMGQLFSSHFPIRSDQCVTRRQPTELISANARARADVLGDAVLYRAEASPMHHHGISGHFASRRECR